MAETLTAVKANTEMTNTTLVSQKAEASNVATETQRNLADTVVDRSDPSTMAGGGLNQITKILNDIRECVCECQCTEDGEGGGFGDLIDLAKNLPGVPGGTGKQTGGFIYPSPVQAFANGGKVLGAYKVPGTSTGDNHDMVVPQDSFVLNREASKVLEAQVRGSIPPMPDPLGYQEGNMVPVKTESQEMVFGPGSWSSLIPILNQVIPRFQSGGLIQHLHGDPNRKGFDFHGHGQESNAHDHFAFSSPEIRAEVQKRLASGDTKSGRAYQIGSVHRPGDSGSYHSVGQALDIPWSQFGSGELGKKDYEQSQQLLADVKAVLKSMNANTGSNNTSQPATSPQSSGKPQVKPSGGGVAALLGQTQPNIGPKALNGRMENSFKNLSDFNYEFFDGYTSDVHSSNNTHMFDRSTSLDPNLANDLGSVMKNMFGGVMNILTGGNASDIMALLSGKKSPNTTGEMAPGKGAAGMMSSTGKSGGEVPSTVSGANGKLLSFIASGEGGYNSMNQGTSGDKIVGSTHDASSKLGKNLTDMTIDEVMSSQASGQLFAAGRYQIIPSTLRDYALPDSGLKGSDMFSKENQDKLGLALIYGSKRPGLGTYLKGGDVSLDSAHLSFAQEWASIPDPNKKGNQSFYGNGNRALHTKEEVRAALEAARAGIASEQKKQTGGVITPFGNMKGMQPVKVESGELIFPPGSFGPEIPQLNSSVPRFASGGMVAPFGNTKALEPAKKHAKEPAKKHVKEPAKKHVKEPEKVKSGEFIFSPGSFAPEIPQLNSSVPRFTSGGMVSQKYQSGGMVGQKYQRGGNVQSASPRVDSSHNVQNFVTNRFNRANDSMNQMSQEKPQPIVVPVPMMPPGGQPSGDDGAQTGTAMPSLTSSPSNHIVSSLMMSSYSLMQRIG